MLGLRREEAYPATMEFPGPRNLRRKWIAVGVVDHEINFKLHTGKAVAINSASDVFLVARLGNETEVG